MAAIDKTYVTSYDDYINLKEWASQQSFTCPNGQVIKPIKYMYKWDKRTWDETQLDYIARNGKPTAFPVLNTPEALDYFLIKYCPFQFVQDRMKEVYSEDYINKIINGESDYDHYHRIIGNNIKCIKYPKFGNKSKLQEPKKWLTWITVEYQDTDKLESFWYNEDYDTWVESYELGTATTNVCTKPIKSVKALIRKIRKWRLPKNTIVTFSGKYVDNEFEFLIY